MRSTIRHTTAQASHQSNRRFAQGQQVLLAIGVFVSACCTEQNSRHADPAGSLPPTAVISPDSSTDSRSGGLQPPGASQSQTFAQHLGPWFESGPGQQALLARHRQDNLAAAKHLDTLLASPDLPEKDRSAASLLRGLVHEEQKEFSAAATHFAAARHGPSLTAIHSRIQLLEAQARLDSSEPTLALELTESLKPTPVLAPQVLLVRSDALWRTDDFSQASQGYADFLLQFPSHRRAHEARSKLAKLLLAQPSLDPNAERATKLLTRLALDVPLSDYGRKAKRELDKLNKGPGPKNAGKSGNDRVHELALLNARFKRHKYAKAIAQADRMMRRKQSQRDKCEILYVKGSSIFKQRKRAQSRPTLLKAATACKRAGETDLEVKTRYQAARGAYALGKRTQAATEFELLASSFANHSYADDALILAGESWQDAGEPAKAKAAYHRSIDKHPTGDMVEEAVRRALLMSFAEQKYAEALSLCDRAIAGIAESPKTLAKLHYYRGRALDHQGRSEEATEAWLNAIETLPLSYPSLVALSRLKDKGHDSWEQGLARLSRDPSASEVDLVGPSNAAAERARILARLGIHHAVAEELESAQLNGWPAIAILAQSGLFSESQKLLANLGQSWKQTPPNSKNRQLWQLAHPRPFADVIEPREPNFELPQDLIFALMQTESRFNPNAVSWAGARGLVQLMPATAKSVAEQAGKSLSPSQLLDPATNLDLGMRYLGRLRERYGSDEISTVLAIPSYNAGAGSVERWLKERNEWDTDLWIEAIPYKETRHYVQSVLGRWMAYRWLYRPDSVPYIPQRLPQRT